MPEGEKNEEQPIETDKNELETAATTEAVVFDVDEFKVREQGAINAVRANEEMFVAGAERDAAQFGPVFLESASEMKANLQVLEATERGFWKRFSEIITAKDFRTGLQEKDLAIPDNEHIIEDLRAQVEKIKGRSQRLTRDY